MIFSTPASSHRPYPPRDKRTFGNDDRNNSVSTHTFRVLFSGARQGCRRCGFAGEIKNRQQNHLAVGTKSCDPAVPPNIETASLPLPLIGCQHSQASNASFTSSATRHLSPQPSGAHIIGFGPCRHHTAADSLLVRHPFSSRQRFVKLFLCYHRIFPLSTVLSHLSQFPTIFYASARHALTVTQCSLRLPARKIYLTRRVRLSRAAGACVRPCPICAASRRCAPCICGHTHCARACTPTPHACAFRRPRTHRLVPHACVPFITDFYNDVYLISILFSVIFISGYSPLPVHYS